MSGNGAFQFALCALEGQNRSLSCQPISQHRGQIQSPIMVLALDAVSVVADIATRRIGFALQPYSLTLDWKPM